MADRVPAAVIGGQRGQAIVAVMVVMLILFALAGAVAIGAESLLGHRNATGATNDDFRARSAVNDSIAQVAGSAHSCSAAPPPSPLPTPTTSPVPTSLTLALPPPDAQAQLRTQCARMDGVTIDGVTRLSVPATTCRTIPLGMLPQGPVRVAVLFDVRVGGSGGGWAYLDGNTGTPCGNAPPAQPSGPDDDSPCVSTFGHDWTQVALTCDIPQAKTAQLHIKASQTSPAQVFVAQQNVKTGSLGSAYLLAVQTPISSPALEEILLFVSGDGSTDRLLYEAPLQP
ncbi:MAG TPA: hypothetical protein VE953_01405 [Terriglobales bacterium]|nr:hypothetical protein [Terriglobales bacterium]